MDNITVLFQLEKETKNTIRYTEVSDQPIVGMIYIQKAALKGLGKDKPQGITIQIQLSKEEE